MSARFTLDGGSKLEAHLSSVCEAVRGAVLGIAGTRLEAVLLGGGYGRGEGGVLRAADGERPYNDLEFYVCLKGPVWWNECRKRKRLHDAAEELTRQAGVEIELKATSIERIRRSSPAMFWYDLVMGHRWVFGDESLLKGLDHHRDPGRIPLHEATRLLMNRCSGLLFAKERLERMEFGPEDADFAGRNLAKAQLGFGDAVLAACGQYHWSCRERHRRLEKFEEPTGMPWLDDVKREHCVGTEFKLHPVQRADRAEAFREEWLRLAGLGQEVWLWLERQRLNFDFRSAREYGSWKRNTCPEWPRWKSALINVRVFGLGGAMTRPPGWYPRDRLLRALALLLWPSDGWKERETGKMLRKVLRTPAEDFRGLVRAYELLWKRFN